MTSGGAPSHVPVLLAEALDMVRPADGDLVVDGTFGAGGYARAILGAARCKVIALDRDPEAVAGGVALVAAHAGRLAVIEAPFASMESAVRTEIERGGGAAEGPLADAVVLDIGVSSMQLDRPERGFSFQADGPLDMRMGPGARSAAELVATASEPVLADVLHKLGEERQSRRIARAIVRAREAAPIATTRQLAAVVERAIGPARGDERHPATRTFQALRMLVNDELGQLAAGLAAAERILKPGGRLVVVAFHSLEDRVVKRFLARRARPAPAGSRHAPPAASPTASRPPSFRLVNQRPIHPSDREVAANPRARSARLRAAERTDAAPWPPEDAAELGIPSIEEPRRRSA